MDFVTAIAKQLIAEHHFTLEDVEEAARGKYGKVENAVSVVLQDMTPAELGIISASRQSSRPRVGETRVAGVRVPVRLNPEASGFAILLDLAIAALTDRTIDLARQKEPIAST